MLQAKITNQKIKKDMVVNFLRETLIALLSLGLIAFILWGIIGKTSEEDGLINKLRAIFGDLF